MLEQPQYKFNLMRRNDRGGDNDDDYEDGDNQEYNEYNNYDGDDEMALFGTILSKHQSLFSTLEHEPFLQFKTFIIIIIDIIIKVFNHYHQVKAVQ